MYCDYWQLKEPPFENVSNSRFVFYSANHDEALMRLFYCVKSQKGACMLTGEVGSGKTTISKVFQENLNSDEFQVAMITHPNLSSTELLQEIVFQLGIEGEYTAKLQLLHALRDKLQQNLRAGIETIIIIDEAHLIKKKEIYEELRLLLNFQKDNRFLLTLILVGQPELKYSMRQIPQFEQRIPIKYHLQPLSFVDMCKYIHFRLKTAGMKEKLFTAEAAKKIYRYSEGIPRKINNICDMSLLTGFVEQAPEIDHRIVDKVIIDEG